jgi:hypothetical protein
MLNRRKDCIFVSDMKSIRLSNGDPIKPVKQVKVEGPGGEVFYVDDPESSVHGSDTLSYVTNSSDRILRQMMAETGGERDPDRAVSPAGARGRWQIMPATQKDLEDRGFISKGLDPFDPLDSRIMRDAKIEAISGLSFVKSPPKPIPEVNRLARIYGSYNAGEGTVLKALERAKAEGVDIYGDPREWLEYLPKETQGYIQKILFEEVDSK